MFSGGAPCPHAVLEKFSKFWKEQKVTVGVREWDEGLHWMDLSIDCLIGRLIDSCIQSFIV